MGYLPELLESCGNPGSHGAAKEPQCYSCPVKWAIDEVETKILLNDLGVPQDVKGIYLQLIMGGK